MAGMARNHHWVPQCYLKGFSKGWSKNSQLHVVDAVAQRQFMTLPRNVASAQDFNRIDIEGVAPDHIETSLAKFEVMSTKRWDEFAATGRS
jgi:hypothetical protein